MGCAGLVIGAFYAGHMMDRGEYAPDRAVLLYGAAPVAGPTRTEAVQLHVAPGDDFFTDQEIPAALTGFAKAGIAVERYDYPGLRHWFAEVDSPAYDQEGARIATQRTLAFLGLGAGS
jgi:carboxymethylenebutenolidase